MASVFVLLEAFNRKEAAALGFFPCATAPFAFLAPSGRGLPPQRVGERASPLAEAFPLYSAALGSAINSPGIRQSDDSPTMMNTVRDSQLMLPPSSHPTALNPQMP